MTIEQTATPTREFEAIQTVYKALEPLGIEGRTRVMNYMVSLLGIANATKVSSTDSESDEKEAEENVEQEDSPDSLGRFSTFAELHNKANPVTNADSALVAAYWVQNCEEGNKENFGSQAINKELKELGIGVKNITGALTQLKASKPAFILQVRKGGKSRQARKTYKITDAGLKRIQEMICERTAEGK